MTVSCMDMTIASSESQKLEFTWTTLMRKQTDIGRVAKCQDDEKWDEGDEVNMKSKSGAVKLKEKKS